MSETLGHIVPKPAWHASMSATGAGIGAITDMPWGMREFSFTDSSGNLIRVGHNL